MAFKHALVVDDSKSARIALKKLLEKHQLIVDFAETGEAASGRRWPLSRCSETDSNPSPGATLPGPQRVHPLVSGARCAWFAPEGMGNLVGGTAICRFRAFVGRRFVRGLT